VNQGPSLQNIFKKIIILLCGPSAIPERLVFNLIGNKSVPKIIVNDTVNYFFFKLQSAFW